MRQKIVKLSNSRKIIVDEFSDPLKLPVLSLFFYFKISGENEISVLGRSLLGRLSSD